MSRIHVHIGRLVVDASLRGDGTRWDNAIERALQAQWGRTPAADAPFERHAPETAAQHIARQIGNAVSAKEGKS